MATNLTPTVKDPWLTNQKAARLRKKEAATKTARVVKTAEAVNLQAGKVIPNVLHRKVPIDERLFLYKALKNQYE